MNLDFSAEPLFSWYVVFLALSGIITLGLGVGGPGVKVGLRILNILVGIGFLGYAFYLAFVFEGGTYTIFFKAFIAPVLLIVATVKAIVERGNKKAEQPAAPMAGYNPNVPYNPNAPQQAPFNPNAAAPQAPGAPAQPQAWQPAAPAAPVAPQGAAPYQPGVPAQPVADNPYAQPTPPHQPGA
ncbi:hypothetical protein [Kitasatospora sp. NPDC101183]|uniref:hypothetical protein n=1 Tax=Kitasatospora sp. NPDC101183 TaxID=3364100 RepID=UPI0037F71D05